MIIVINYSVALIYKGLSENILSCIGRMSTNMKNSISTYFIFVMYNEQKNFRHTVGVKISVNGTTFAHISRIFLNQLFLFFCHCF